MPRWNHITPPILGRHTATNLGITMLALTLLFACDVAAQATITEIPAPFPSTVTIDATYPTYTDSNGRSNQTWAITIDRNQDVRLSLTIFNRTGCQYTPSVLVFSSCYPGSVADMNSDRRCSEATRSVGTSPFTYNFYPKARSGCNGYTCATTITYLIQANVYASTQNTASCAFSITADTQPVCTPGHGEVDAQTYAYCRCFPGWAGPTCASPAPVDVTANVTLTSSFSTTVELAPGNATYFSYKPRFLPGGQPFYYSYSTSFSNPSCRMGVTGFCGTSYNDTQAGYCANRWPHSYTGFNEYSYWLLDRPFSCGCRSYVLAEDAASDLTVDFSLVNTSPDTPCNATLSVSLRPACFGRGLVIHNDTSYNYVCTCNPGYLGTVCEHRNQEQPFSGVSRTYAVGHVNRTVYIQHPGPATTNYLTVQLNRLSQYECRDSIDVQYEMMCGNDMKRRDSYTFDDVVPGVPRTVTLNQLYNAFRRPRYVEECLYLYRRNQVTELLKISTPSSGLDMSCPVEVKVTRSPNCMDKCKGTCSDLGVCVCNPGTSGINCHYANRTQDMRELYNSFSFLGLHTNESELVTFWIQGSRSNSRLWVHTAPAAAFWTYDAEDKLAAITESSSRSPSAFAGDVVLMAKWGSPPRIQPDHRPLLMPWVWVEGFNCTDCVATVRGPLVGNTTLKVDPKSMPASSDNMRLYVSVGITGRYGNSGRVTTSTQQRRFQVRVEIADPNESTVPTVFIIVACVFVAYVFIGAAIGGKMDPVRHYHAIEHFFDSGFRFVEYHILRDMQVSGVNMHNLALEKQAREEAAMAKQQHEAAKAAAAEMASAGGDSVEMSQIQTQLPTSSSSSSSSPYAHTGQDDGSCHHLSIGSVIFIVIINLITLFAGVVKTIFNVSLMATSLSKFLPDYDFELVYPSIELALGGFGELVRLFITFLRSIDFTLVSTEWNCNGFATLIAPILVLMGALFLRLMLKREFLLLLSMYFKSLKKRQTTAKGKAFATLVANLATAAVFYVSQVIIVTIGDLSLGLGGGRNCGATDLEARNFGFVFTLVVLSLFIYAHWEMFTGYDPLVHKAMGTITCEQTEEQAQKNPSAAVRLGRALIQLIPHVIVVKVLFGVFRLLMLAVGLWNSYMVKAFSILPRSRKYDDDKWDVDSQQEAVIANVGRSSALIFMIAPGPTLIAGKFVEVLNNPPVLDLAQDAQGHAMLELKTGRGARAVKFFSNLFNMIFTVAFVFDFSLFTLVLAFVALIPAFFVDTVSDLQ